MACEALAIAWDKSPSAMAAARACLGSMDKLLLTNCLGQLPEIIDGDAPHTARGCDAQAWSVTEALRVWKWLCAKSFMEAKLQPPPATTPPILRTGGNYWMARKNMFLSWPRWPGCLIAWVSRCLSSREIRRLSALMPAGTPPDILKKWGGYTMAIFVLGWATGGLIFGAVGDRIGRARSLAITILLYGLCTGLSGFSTSITDFCVYRFITGLGVGGVFGLAVALCADSLPDKARPHALGLFQALSALGNIIAGITAVCLGYCAVIDPSAASGWRCLFIFGALPRAGLRLLPISDEGAGEMGGGARPGKNRRRSLRLLCFAFWRGAMAQTGVVRHVVVRGGRGGIVGHRQSSVPELVNDVIGKALTAQHVPAAQLPGKRLMWVGLTMIVQNFGSFLGMMTFTKFAHQLRTEKSLRRRRRCARFSARSSPSSF